MPLQHRANPRCRWKAVAVSTVDRKAGERSHRWPRGLPGGQTILYSIGLGGSWDNATIVAHDLDKGTRKVIVNGGCDARYVSTGRLVYVRGIRFSTPRQSGGERFRRKSSTS